MPALRVPPTATPPPPLPRYPAPPPPPQREPRRTGLGAASVPRILLGLGAGCVLVAAVIFLAVAWSWLGIGGRTAVLVTLTAASAALGQWLARRDLRVAAEALTAIALGLLTLDLVGARDAGWVSLRLDVLVGAALLAASLALLRRLTAQVVAPVGLAVLAAGIADATGQVEPAALGVVLGGAALGWLGRRLVLLPWSAVAVGGCAYLALLGAAGLRAAADLSLTGLWLEGHGWWLLIAGALPLAHRYSRPVAAVVLSGVVALPAADEGTTAVALGAAALIAVWGVVARRWDGAWAPVGVAALVSTTQVLVLVGQAFGALTGGTVVPAAHPLVLPLTALAAVVAAPWRWRAATAALWLSSVLAAVLLATDVPADLRALAVVAAAGLLALLVPRLEAEVAAWTIGLGALAAAGLPALDLTVAGALVSASAMVHRDRRLLGWAGGLLLAAATWVQLAEIGVETPEAYTLPAACALLALGLLRLRREPAADSMTLLLPGLLLATVPSLVLVLVDPVSPRAVALGLACLVLLLAGTALQWSAPVVVGAVVGGLLVLRELAPYAVQTPQWVLIGAAGTLLIGVGVTWEARLRDLRAASGYLGRLR